MSKRSQTGRKVYIANVGGHNYDKARRWGDLVPVTTGRVDLLHTERLEQDIHNILSKAYEKDYILLSGSPVVNVLCVGYLYRKHGLVHTLFWDGRMSDYIERKLTFKDRRVPDEFK